MGLRPYRLVRSRIPDSQSGDVGSNPARVTYVFIEYEPEYGTWTIWEDKYSPREWDWSNQCWSYSEFNYFCPEMALYAYFGYTEEEYLERRLLKGE